MLRRNSGTAFFAESKPMRSALIPAAVIGIPLVLLLALQFRALDRFEDQTNQVLRQASAQMAQEVVSHIRQDFKSPLFNLIERVDHTAIREGRLDVVARDLYEHRRYATFIDTFFVWSARGARGKAGPEQKSLPGEVFFFRLPPLNSGRVSVSEKDFFRDEALSADLLANAVEYTTLGSTYGLVFRDIGGRKRDVVFHLLYDLPESKNLRAFIGFTVEAERLAEGYFHPLVSQARSTERRLSGVGPISVSILDDRQREVYRSGESLLHRFESEVKFPFFFFDVDLIGSMTRWFAPEIRYWSVRTGYPESSVATLAREQTNRQRLVWLVVALVAVAGVVLTVRATLRELRLVEMKSAFVSSVSHDLKTPLASIKMFADTLESGRARTGGKVRQYGRIIAGEASRLENLIEGILDFDRLESGISSYPVEVVEVRAVLESALASFQNQLEQQGFRTELDLPAEEVRVLGNREGLLRVFRNLISNAIKYSDRERYLRVALAKSDRQAVVEVIDHGVGIPAAEQRRVFRKFYRLVQDPATGSTGTGIGLSLVAHIIKALGGRVSLRSEPGSGSTFRVELPLPKGAYGEAHPGR
jgi:signal transduction histidine kinase